MKLLKNFSLKICEKVLLLRLDVIILTKSYFIQKLKVLIGPINLNILD